MSNTKAGVDNSENPLRIFVSSGCVPGMMVRAELKDGSVVDGQVLEVAANMGKTGSSTLVVDAWSSVRAKGTPDLWSVNWRNGAQRVSDVTENAKPEKKGDDPVLPDGHIKLGSVGGRGADSVFLSAKPVDTTVTEVVGLRALTMDELQTLFTTVV